MNVQFPISNFQCRRGLVCGLVALLMSTPCQVRAQEESQRAGVVGSSGIDWAAVGQEAAQLLSRYIHVNTTNPPGNEIAAARLLREVLIDEGIEFLLLDQPDGKVALIAWLRAGAQPQKGGVILLNHMDVVAAEPEHWSVDPFAGKIRGGYIWGRGALDMKGMGIAQLMVLLTLKRHGPGLTRDIIFLATSDEEIVGGGDAGVLVRENPDLFADAEYVINEGGTIRLDDNGALRYYGVGITEKSPFWQRVTARGTAGHGSQPIDSSAVNRLVQALERIRAWETEVRVTPPVAEFFRRLSESVPPVQAALFSDISATLADSTARELILSDRYFNAILRNTISITSTEAGSKTNVIPSVAEAELDVRLLPGADSVAFLAELRRQAGATGDSLTIEPMAPTWSATASPSDSELFQAVEALVRAYEPGAAVLPYVQAGFTDSHYFRDIGIKSYGIGLFKLSASESERAHGNDERLSLENLQNGIRFLYEILVKIGT